MICIVIRKFRITSLEIFKCLIKSTNFDPRRRIYSVLTYSRNTFEESILEAKKNKMFLYSLHFELFIT